MWMKFSFIVGEREHIRSIFLCSLTSTLIRLEPSLPGFLHLVQLQCFLIWCSTFNDILHIYCTLLCVQGGRHSFSRTDYGQNSNRRLRHVSTDSWSWYCFSLQETGQSIESELKGKVKDLKNQLLKTGAAELLFINFQAKIVTFISNTMICIERFFTVSCLDESKSRNTTVNVFVKPWPVIYSS